MLSYDTRNKLADTLLSIADGERQIEIVRQILCEQRDFEPYAAFKRLDRDQKGVIDAVDLVNFLADNRVYYTEENAQIFINRYDIDGDGQLVYEEFLYAVLPMDNPTLRTVATQRPNYNVQNYQWLSYDVEYSLAKVIDREIAFYLKVDYLKVSLQNSYDFNSIDAFSAIDRLSTGFIDFNNLNEFFRRLGIYPTEEELVAILRRIDRNDDGRLGYQEFAAGIEPVDVSTKTKPISTGYSPSRNSVTKSSRLGTSPLKRRTSPVRQPLSPTRASLAYRTASPLRRTFSPNSSRVSDFSRTETAPRKIATPGRKIASPTRLTSTIRTTASPHRRIISPTRRRIVSPLKKEASPYRRTASPLRREASPTRLSSTLRTSGSPSRRIASPTRITSTIRTTASPYRRIASPTRRIVSPVRKEASPYRRVASPSRITTSPPRRSVYSPLRETKVAQPTHSRRLLSSPGHRATTASPSRILRRSPLKTTLNRGLLTAENKAKHISHHEKSHSTADASLRVDRDIIKANPLKSSLGSSILRQSSPLRQTLNRSLIPKSPTHNETLQKLLGRSELSASKKVPRSSEKLGLSLSGTKRSSERLGGSLTARELNKDSGYSGKKVDRKAPNESHDVLIDVLKQFIQLEKELEAGKQDLALRPDFNMLDFFRTFDIDARGAISSHEFAEGMKKYGVYPNKEELFLLMRRLDRDNDGKLKFSDFNEAFLCKQQEYASLLSNRTPINADLSLKVTEALTEDTRRAIGRVLRLHLNNEGATESLRQRLSRKPSFNPHEAFSYLDVDSDGYVNADELRQVLDQHDYYATQRELKLLVDRLDGNRDGKVSYSEFVHEIVPKSERIF